jgi:LPXTG-motif cell wall-anchored protein
VDSFENCPLLTIVYDYSDYTPTVGDSDGKVVIGDSDSGKTVSSSTNSTTATTTTTKASSPATGDNGIGAVSVLALTVGASAWMLRKRK